MSSAAPEKLDAICFDLDGTLYVQRPLRLAMMSRLLVKHLKHPQKGYQAFRILSAYRQAQELLREAPSPSKYKIAEAQIRMSCQMSGFDADQVTKCISTWFETEPLSLLHRYVRPGLVEFLQSARKRGIKLAVLSDYPAEAKLAAMKLREYFDLVVCAQDEEIQCLKPNPAGLQFVLKKLAIDKAKALYVGDRVAVDAEAAQRAGVRAAIVGQQNSSTKPESCLMVRDFKHLQTVLSF